MHDVGARRAPPIPLADADGARRTVELAPSTHAAAAELSEPIAVIDLVLFSGDLGAELPGVEVGA